MKKRLHLGMEKKQMLEGYVFLSPFIIGFLVFFLFPLYISIKLSFGKIVKMQGFNIQWKGLENYVKVFVVDTSFIPMFISVVRQTLLNVPLIVIFSLLLAIAVNKNLKGKGFFRVALFLPFLLGTGEIMKMLLNQGITKEVISLGSSAIIPKEVFLYLGSDVYDAINTFFSIIVYILWNSGVQILLFLSGLQGISSSLYESAKVDGATEWEMFWKITIPMISPITLLNIIYTLTDSFVNVNNPIINYIITKGFQQMQYEFAAAIGWVYFLFVVLLIITVVVVMNRYIYNTNASGVRKNAKKYS